MAQKIKILNVLLVAFLIVGVPTPSSGFGLLGGGGGSSSVGEILAAGLITGMLMNNGPSQMMQALRVPFLGGYGFMPPRYAMQPMMAPKVPMMASKVPMMASKVPMMGHIVLPMMYRPQHMMNQALITEATKHESLASRLNEEIKALEAQESILEAYLERYQKGGDPALSELLNQEDTIPAAALLLGTEFMNAESGIENAHPLPGIPSPELFQTEGSENESRYLLPRIVKHFVQRLMRRAENH